MMGASPGKNSELERRTTTRGRRAADARAGRATNTGLAAGATTEGHIAYAALEDMSFGVMLLDARAEIIFANRMAREIAARGDALVAEGGCVRFLQAGVQAGFERHLASGSATPWFALSLARSTGKRAYALLVKPLAGELAMHACYLYDFDEQRSVTESLLGNVYGLTAAEARIAMHLFGGMNVETVARTVAIRESTVRAHLTRILAKCEVPSLAALLQHLALGPRMPREF